MKDNAGLVHTAQSRPLSERQDLILRTQVDRHSLSVMQRSVSTYFRGSQHMEPENVTTHSIDLL